MNKRQILKLVVSILLPLGLGAIAGIFTAKAIPEWYATLNQPSFNPPNWIFGPVWTSLYILLGISFFLIWKQPATKERNRAISIFLIQLVLNFAWSFLFFYFHQIGLALIDIIVLWILIITMLILFYRIKPLAAYINIPYLLWVTFASILNASYFVLN
ncbi:MAG TPA: tryptophan-rich sensory protein [Saprospiraceae bacterium]|nr:tryptophan-rich sensory protein [Saprospiraceae bacterium]